MSEPMELCVNKLGGLHRRQNKFGKLWELSSAECTVSRELLQLDIAAFMLRNYGGEREQN